MSADTEFHGKRFYPAAFFFKTLHDQPDKVAETCRVLNGLSEVQQKAVEFLVDDRVAEQAFFSQH